MRTPLPATVPNRSPHSSPLAKSWKTLLAALGLGVLSAVPAHAQLDYTFTNTTSTWSSIYGAGGGTSISGDLQNGDPDDDITFDEPIGFNFNYQGVDYDRFILDTNGFLTLGTIEPEDIFGTSPTATTGSILREVAWQNNHSLAVFNMDVIPGNQGQNDYLYKLTGSPGSRVLTVEWHDVGEYTGTGYPPAQFNSFSFQVKLYEGSNRIEYVYGPMVVTANTPTAKVASVGLRGQSPLAGQVIFLSKASGTAWSAAAVGVVPAGGYGGGTFAVNAHNYRNSAPPAVGQTYRFTPTTINDNNVSVAVYTLSEVANPQGMPHAVKARITNETGVAIGPFNVHLDVSGTLTIGGTPTPFNFTDDKNVTVPGYAGDPRPQITFAPYTVPSGATGNLTVTVTANNAGDQVPANNTATFTTAVTTASNSYATSAPIAGGSGFTGAYGEFVARFHTTTSQEIDGAKVEFATSGRDYQLIVLAADGLGGTPGTVLYASGILQSQNSGPAVIPVLPAITVTGDFFVGVRQTTTNNIGLGYEIEDPIRSGAFYYRGSASFPVAGAWNDYAAANSPFRAIVSVSFSIPTNLPPNCAALVSPANNATGILTSGVLQYGSGGGSPTGFKVYLSTNQNAVINELPSALVTPTPVISTQYSYSGLLGLTNYYWKVVPVNANGSSTNCLVRKFTTDVAAPSNDDCTNARTLTVRNFGDCPSNGTAGTTAGATELNGSTDPTCSGGNIADVWYKFNTGGTKAVIVYTTLGTANQIGWALYSSCGGTSLGCTQLGNGAFSIGGLQRNTVYWLRMFTNRSLTDVDPNTAGNQAPVAGSFNVCVSKPTDVTNISGTNTLPTGDYGTVSVQGGTLTVGGNSTANDVYVYDGATLNTGTNTLSGGRFFLYGGGTLGIGSTAGITPLGSPTGSIQFDLVRSFSDDANYVYSNTLPGVTGAGLPSTVRSLTAGPSSAGSLGLTNPLMVRRMVTLSNASLNASTAQLTLMSRCNATNVSDNTTAMVVNGGIGVVQGAVKVQRCLEGDLNPGIGYRHLSAPISNATINSLATNGFTPVLNPSYDYLTDTLITSNPPFPNVFFFNEPVAGTSHVFLEGYKSPASTATPMTPMQGFAVYTRPSAVFQFIGTLNNGPINRAATNSGSTDEGAGWNLFGNPYPSPIDWDLVTVPAGISSSLSMWRSTGAGTSGNYVQYVNGVGPANSDIIPMGHGFFVQKSTAGSATLTLNNAARVTSYQNPSFMRQQETRPLVALTLAPLGQASQMDRAYVYFEQGATVDGNDDRYDAVKLPAAGSVPTLFTRAGTEKMAINGLPALNGTEVRIPLVAAVSTTGIYVLNAEEVINFAGGQQVLLEDALTGTTQDLSVNSTYTFRATAGNTTPRFTLVFTAGRVNGLNEASLQAQLAVYPNPVSNQNLKVELGGLTRGETAVALRLINALGQVVSQQEVKVANAAITAELNTHSLGRGIYTLQVLTNGRTVSRQVVVQ